MLPETAGLFRSVAPPNNGTYSDNTKWAMVRVAANRKRRDENGNWVDVAKLFVTLVATGYNAEILSGMDTGTEVFARGELQTQEWEKDGERRSATQIKVRECRLTQRNTPQDSQDSQGGPAGFGSGQGQQGGGFGSHASSGAGGFNQGYDGGGFGADEPPF